MRPNFCLVYPEASIWSALCASRSLCKRPSHFALRRSSFVQRQAPLSTVTRIVPPNRTSSPSSFFTPAILALPPPQRPSRPLSFAFHCHLLIITATRQLAADRLSLYKLLHRSARQYIVFLCKRQSQRLVLTLSQPKQSALHLVDQT